MNQVNKIPAVDVHICTHKILCKHLNKITDKMDKDEFHPDIIIGITRGGLVPAVMLSHYYGAEMIPVNLSLRDFKKDRKAVNKNIRENINFANLSNKEVLIVDDIVDSGITVKELVDTLDTFWSYKLLKIACLYYNISNEYKVIPNYYAKKIDKKNDNTWIQFAYEKWNSK